MEETKKGKEKVPFTTYLPGWSKEGAKVHGQGKGGHVDAEPGDKFRVLAVRIFFWCATWVPRGTQLERVSDGRGQKKKIARVRRVMKDQVLFTFPPRPSSLPVPSATLPWLSLHGPKRGCLPFFRHKQARGWPPWLSLQKEVAYLF